MIPTVAFRLLANRSGLLRLLCMHFTDPNHREISMRIMNLFSYRMEETQSHSEEEEVSLIMSSIWRRN